MSAYFNRYSKWDGTQQINPITPDEIMRALSDDLLNEGDLNLAMQRLFRFGFQGENGERFSGLREMLERVRQKRMEQLQRYDLGSIMEQIQQKLGEIVQTERDAIDKRVADARERSDGIAIGDKSDAERESDGASDTNNDDLQRLLEQITDRKRAQLDALPGDPAGQIKGLQEYEFMSPKAAEEFRQLLDQLQQQVMQQTFEGMQQSLSDMSPEDLAEMRQMMSELNDMIERRARGEDPGFNEFMHRWGHYFGSDINDLDELLERMKQRMGAMQQLMNSMTPEQREQLMGSMQAAMQDPGLQEQMSRLNQNLGLMQGPGQGQDWRQGYQFSGSEQLSLAEAMRMLDNINDIDKLEQDLRDVRDWRDLDALLDDRFKEILGDEAAEQLDQLSKMAATLEEAGLIKKNRRGYELTPQGVRKIGEKALEDIFLHLKHDKSGQHELHSVGTAGERIDVTKPYEFGDPFLLDLPKTVMNAVQRQGAGSPVRLHPDDFEVYKTEHVTRSSTVIMVDMSRSMFYNGCFAAARKVTLALESLIRSRFPKDDLSILGFSYIAEPLKAIDLPTLEWNEYQYGTNMQHGFQLARQILARQKGTNKQIILITDGEPTAHIENGHVQFQYPPTPRTFEMTLKEVIRCTRDGITINTFMLEQTPYLINFVNDLMQINKGRVFLSTADRLGEYVLVDYVAHKQKWIG